ncbi:SDR family NAD(P)-dependent oxidoreductase [Leisingera sp. ANG59]|uniref:SDR family NAD(P)-dependent oxidoreductase n=1 Tax=Leisingera sp. ANG59 TaxID=2675221 RepID=UPI0015726F07|nr:SDR family NAD(P)-dependent oxidoreductase [Leisingera sp. ANG59]NSY41169.1 glucose 1-dehydrogenase [Leisingera sp. ANG59]
MANRFENKTVIVTGGAGGIGDAICRRFASEGAFVWVADSNAAAAEALAASIRDAGGQADIGALDLCDANAIHDFVAEITNAGQTIDVLCNNAGINRRGALMELTPQDWSLSFKVNVDAIFHMCQAVVPHMQRQGGGAIVNTASQWGLHPAPGHIAYNTTKAAVAAFTQNLARDYAKDKIRVNAVCPGEVRTPMLESNLARTGRSLEELNALVPYGRIGEPEEVAALVAFLASDEAPYLCGSLIEITGSQAVA